MIHVIYYPKYSRVTVEGHAQSGEPGHDLVCAACTAIVYTLAANVQNFQSTGEAMNPIVKLEPGQAEISCTPRSRYKAVVRRILDAVCAGFELLADHNKDYISFEIHG